MNSVSWLFWIFCPSLKEQTYTTDSKLFCLDILYIYRKYLPWIHVRIYRQDNGLMQRIVEFFIITSPLPMDVGHAVGKHARLLFAALSAYSDCRMRYMRIRVGWSFCTVKTISSIVCGKSFSQRKCPFIGKCLFWIVIRKFLLFENCQMSVLLCFMTRLNMILLYSLF